MAHTHTHTHPRSKDFNNFLSLCLIKDPHARAAAADLISHPFIEGITDFRPLRVLYQERRAEVVELVEDLPEDADIMHREIQHVVRARRKGRREEGGRGGRKVNRELYERVCVKEVTMYGITVSAQVHSAHLCRKRHSPFQNLRLLPQRPLPPHTYHQTES